NLADLALILHFSGTYFYGTKFLKEFRARAARTSKVPADFIWHAAKICSFWKRSLNANVPAFVRTSPQSDPGVDRISVSANASQRRHHLAYGRQQRPGR